MGRPLHSSTAICLALLVTCAVGPAAAADSTNCSGFSQPRFLPGLPGMQPGTGSEAQAPQVSVMLINCKRTQRGRD